MRAPNQNVKIDTNICQPKRVKYHAQWGKRWILKLGITIFNRFQITS